VEALDCDNEGHISVWLAVKEKEGEERVLVREVTHAGGKRAKHTTSTCQRTPASV